jgi:putative flavoprotein involved in K+ transport
MEESVETVIIGAGQAGLATSYCLGQLKREHLVLEQKAAPASSWRDDRWDSFTLVTPSWTIRLPGAEYAAPDPNGFMPRDEVAQYLGRYAADNRLPIRFGTRVSVVQPQNGPARFRIETSQGTLNAANVVVATGLYQQPRIPGYAPDLPGNVLQLVSGRYRHPRLLPPGAVLVAGGGQSGCQIAEELYQSGRKVYLSIGKAPRAPRRYRGRDIFEWLDLTGFFNRSAEMLPTPRARFAANPTVSGKDGGHTLNLYRFAREGVTLLGHIRGTTDGKISLSPDLAESLAFADAAETNMLGMVDAHIASQGLDVPADEARPELRAGFDQPAIEQLDLRAAGITTVIWATGYRFDFSVVKAAVFDSFGYPIQQRGATPQRGLYFVGLPFLVNQKSGLLWGVGDDARGVAAAIAGAGA